MAHRLHAYYTGRVQGVGFRYTCVDIAAELGVSGWVKNLRDGRVEVMAEAEENVLKEFLSRVHLQFSHYIENVDAAWPEATGEFKGFGIKF